jgi:ribosomal protein S18 acetylase RimI-like enzyme
MQLRSEQISEVSSLAEFMARLQRVPSHHIGYVSDNPDDIASSLLEIDGFEQQFFVAVNDAGICGFIGADLDPDRAWIYGPMCDVKEWDETANALWRQLGPKLGPKLSGKTWLMFADAQNAQLVSFAQRIGCLEHGRESVLEFTRSQLESLHGQVGISRAITEQDFVAFTTLHDAIFPGTYFSGKEILERLNHQRLNHQRKLFLHGDLELLGYSYAEVSDSGQASLEFIGVSEKARGTGTGKDLMVRTLEWIFSFENVEQVSLIVNAKNTAALVMYQKIGFLEVRRMVSYRRNAS